MNRQHLLVSAFIKFNMNFRVKTNKLNTISVIFCDKQSKLIHALSINIDNGSSNFKKNNIILE